jgi:hypothetical protein
LCREEERERVRKEGRKEGRKEEYICMREGGLFDC